MIELMKYLLRRHSAASDRRVDAGHRDDRPRGLPHAADEPPRCDDVPPEPEWLELSRSIWP